MVKKKTTTGGRPLFAFINVSDPKDLTRADNLRAIRSHAWDGGHTHRRRRRGNFTFDLQGIYPENTNLATISPVRQGQIDFESHEDEDRTADTRELEHIRPDRLFSIDYIRPRGAGRGYNPLTPFPIPSNSRIVQLMDFGESNSGHTLYVI
jgi:hypothetical protein